jgi:hypothetical protein
MCNSRFWKGEVIRHLNLITRKQILKIYDVWQKAEQNDTIYNEKRQGWVVCSVSYYYITPTAVGWCIAILSFFFTLILILITSPRLLLGDVLLFYLSFLLFLLFFHTFLSTQFLGDASIKLSVPEWFLFLYFKYWYFRSLKRFWDCDFNFVNVLELQSMEVR